MILEIVTFKTPTGWDRARVVEDAKKTISRWSANSELLRKHYGLGIAEDEGISTGVYVWPTVEAAKKGHDEEWREGVRKRTGSYPVIRYFDLFLLIDNEHRQITEWADDGSAMLVSA